MRLMRKRPGVSGRPFARKAYPDHDEAADDEEDVDARGAEGGQPIRTLPGRGRAQGFFQRVMEDDENRGDTPQNLNTRERASRWCHGGTLSGTGSIRGVPRKHGAIVAHPSTPKDAAELPSLL